MKSKFVFLMPLSALWLGGCTGSEVATDTSVPPPIVKKLDFEPNAAAGLPVPVNADIDLKTLMAMKAGRGRRDPFALLPAEIEYEKSQRAAYLVANSGGFGFYYDEPPVVDDRPVVEPQPYRRLAGIIVGEAITVLIDMGDGQGFQIARPGSRLGEWTVVAIDEEKAVLRRGGNKLPKTIEVYLADPQPAGGGGEQGGGQAGGRTPGGEGDSGDLPGGGRRNPRGGGGRSGNDL